MPGKKELFIVRHAKSSWDVAEITDRDRPLKYRGIRNAYEMARRLKIDRRMPELIISSPANRALHTASIFINVFDMPYSKLLVNESLYACGPNEILKLVQSQSDEIDKLMIFGHNPDFSELARSFAQKPLVELPTCGVGVFSFDCTRWSTIKGDLVRAEYIDFPKKDEHNYLS